MPMRQEDLDRALNKAGPIYRRVDTTIRAVEGDEKKNRFELSFSSEKPVMRYGLPEIMLHTPEAVSLDRMRRSGALLFAHGRDPNYGLVPVGGFESITLDEKKRKCRAVVVLDEHDERAMALARKMESGYLTGISVGALPIERTLLTI
ncbi:MAG: hypothetical protein RRY21_07300 [Oscillospiraceae bacterium]